jgi:hypothetical protein
VYEYDNLPAAELAFGGNLEAAEYYSATIAIPTIEAVFLSLHSNRSHGDSGDSLVDQVEPQVSIASV